MTEVYGGFPASASDVFEVQGVLAQNRYGVPMNKSYVVPEFFPPLKVKGKGQVAVDLQDAEARFAEMRRQAIQLRDAFGVRSYQSKQGEIVLALHYWQKSANSKELSRLRWRWKIPSGKKKIKEIGLIPPMVDVMSDPKHTLHKFVWQFFADIVETPPLFDLIVRFEVSRLEMNARLMEAAYSAKGLSQLFEGIKHAEQLVDAGSPLRMQLRKYTPDHGQENLPGLS